MSALSLRSGAAGGASGAAVVALLQAFAPYHGLPVGVAQPFAHAGNGGGNGLANSAARLFEAAAADCVCPVGAAPTGG
eukprot:9410900-Heterocapsa_arctica.AAC.1